MQLWGRRRRKLGQPSPADGAVAAGVDALLRANASQIELLGRRLDRLETRMEECERRVVEQADSTDLLDLHMHSARLAAELSRVTVELRAEIEGRADRAEAAPIPAPAAAAAIPAADTQAPQDVVDLTERRARQTTGWLPRDDM